MYLKSIDRIQIHYDMPIQPYDEALREKISRNRDGTVLRDAYDELRNEFCGIRQRRVFFPKIMFDEFTQRVLLIKENYNGLFIEIINHKTVTTSALWTEAYFNTELQLLSHWTALMIRQYQELAEAGIDTTDVLKAFEAFHAKIIIIVSRGYWKQLSHNVCPTTPD
jgi:hypothetical protein